MFKIGENSILELPITLLRRIFPWINAYYGESSRHLDAYEHIWLPFIACSVFDNLAQYSKWWLIGILAVFLFHVIWKEVWHDRKKRINPQQWLSFKVDIILRSFFFVLYLPVLAYRLWPH